MSSQPWSAWYKTWRWQKLRERHLRANPLCVMCQAEGRVTEAKVCDHIEPHKGDPEKFWNGPFQSLCKAHHDSDKQALERSGRRKVQIGVDGYPIEGTPHPKAPSWK
ncbi:HNH endonuclease [Achromobacter ruhlandii]|uniref:Uncharacterized protein n=1 Tax=Achromobacter ruhlandii TaxID=72557 RepID=A0A2M9GPZ6_9BURK|nr:HNH endonuclease [Achromobacter ruhlandii]CAB3924930.1 hypothetical protein LMG3328_05738 [Achromobacter ruhlandii]